MTLTQSAMRTSMSAEIHIHATGFSKYEKRSILYSYLSQYLMLGQVFVTIWFCQTEYDREYQ